MRLTVAAVSNDHPQTTDPDGRLVVFDAGSHLHLARRRPWLLDHVDTIMGLSRVPTTARWTRLWAGSASIVSTSSLAAGCGWS